MRPRRAVPRELAEQVALASRLDRAGLLWCHVPNGGRRGRREAVALQASGVKAGVPDVLIFTPPPAGGVGVALELKAIDGAAAPEQRQWLARLHVCGWATVVVYGVDDAVAQLRMLGYVL